MARAKRRRPREEATTRTANIAILIASIATATLTVLGSGQTAVCADLVGRILNNRGQAVSGITVTVVSAADVNAGKGVSDSNGSYAISNLTPGAYKLNIVPDQWVMSYIGEKGLTVNWGLAPHSTPVAVATLGTAADSAGADTAAPKNSHAKSQPETGGSHELQGTTD
jgi:hypothetical protein